MTELVFVYGTLKRDRGNHILLQNAEFIDEYITNESCFKMTSVGFPYVQRIEDGAHIRGEVYKIDAKILASLDSVEGHPHWYQRELVDVADCLNGPEFILAKAWMYLQPETEILPGQEILPDQNNIVEW